MFMDATIMCRNLADLNGEGIIALPIHDSLIVQAKNGSTALEIMERNLALTEPRKSASQSAYQVPQKAQQKSPLHLNTHLHNGHRVVVGRLVPPVPAWVVALPADLASLGVVAWFYGAGGWL
jgi:hypothetical protein